MQSYCSVSRARKSVSWAGLAALLVALTVTVSHRASAEPTLTVLHQFAGGPSDGAYPGSFFNRGFSLLADSAGNLYGTTSGGGTHDSGIVFKITPDRTYSVLHSFAGGTGDGAMPRGDLIADSNGFLYGTTEQGGGSNCFQGCGTIFRLAPDGSAYEVLYSFARTGGSYSPSPGPLVADSAGNVYGAIAGGGDHDKGFVYKFASDGAYSVLHSFVGGPSDGESPQSPGALKVDRAGNLYGTTSTGGAFGFGTIFKRAADGTSYRILHSFSGGNGGANPKVLVIAASGNLYGTTNSGGHAPCVIQDLVGQLITGNCGTVFKLAADGTSFAVLYAFSGGVGLESDGASPTGELIADGFGNLYGVTSGGGSCGAPGGSCGSIFKLALDGTLTKLSGNGAATNGRLIADRAGNLYGTTWYGGREGGCFPDHRHPGCGTLFKLAPDLTHSTLYEFCSEPYCPSGGRPLTGLIVDAAGNLYGTASVGGSLTCSAPFGCGTIFKLSGTGFVTEQQALQATPEAGIVASAAKGGAIFSASSFDYALGVASGSATIEISGIPSWLSPSFTSAHVTAGSPLTATFSLANIGTLARGTYTANLTFTDTTGTHGTTTRSATLRVYEWRDCLNGGWQNFQSSPGPFRNQGQCVAFFGRLMRSGPAPVAAR